MLCEETLFEKRDFLALLPKNFALWDGATKLVSSCKKAAGMSPRRRPGSSHSFQPQSTQRSAEGFFHNSSFILHPCLFLLSFSNSLLTPFPDDHKHEEYQTNSEEADLPELTAGLVKRMRCKLAGQVQL